HPHRAALRHIREMPGPRDVEARLHARSVDAPARLHCDVPLAVDLERGGHTTLRSASTASGALALHSIGGCAKQSDLIPDGRVSRGQALSKRTAGTVRC